MRAYMTNGTLDFLMKLEEKHPKIAFYFMTSGGGALAYYEHEKKKVFSAGRAFEILNQSGDFIKKGFVVMNTITVYKEDQVVFEDRINHQYIPKLQGHHAFRFLKPVKGNEYVILTVWKTSNTYDIWKKSNLYEEADQIMKAKLPAYHSHRPFTTTYYLYNKEEEAN